jgi:HEPN domain-containing protein
MTTDESQTIGRLFEDVDERFERADEWSYPKSISICWPVDEQPGVGMFREYRDRYYRASRSICRMVKQNEIEDYIVSFPVIFLFRHSVELALKGAILSQTGKVKGGHDLDKLWPKINGLPGWSVGWIRELHDLDTRSTALRYPNANVRTFEIGALLTDWELKTKRLHNHLMMLCQERHTNGKIVHDRN